MTDKPTVIEDLETEIRHLRAALLASLPLLEEECRPGAPLLQQVYAALRMNKVL